MALELSSVPDARVVYFIAAVTGLTALLLGLGSALHATRPAFVNAMSAEDRQGERRAGADGVRKTLVVVQIALSVLLLAGAGCLPAASTTCAPSIQGFGRQFAAVRVNVSLSGYTLERAHRSSRRCVDG